jgi:hypothetical protein
MCINSSVNENYVHEEVEEEYVEVDEDDEGEGMISGVARPQATRAFAWGVEEKSFVHCSDFTLFNTV